MKKEDYIVYDYKSRRDVLSDAVMDAISYTYEISYPKPEKSFLEMCKDIHKEAEKVGKDNDDNFRLNYGRYQWPIDFFYIPERVLKEVWDNHKEAAGVAMHWDEDMSALIDFLYAKPGFKEVYSPMYEGGEDVRHSEDQLLIKDVIGEEAAQKLKDILESYKNTYRWGLVEVNQFGWGFMSTPNINRETVVKAWKEAFNKDIIIPEDSAWIDSYEFSDKEYEGEFDEDLNEETKD